MKNGSYRSLEETLEVLLAKAKHGAVTVETVFSISSGRGKIILLIFLSLIFGQIPGVALFLGLFMCFLGFSIAFRRSRIWLPKALLHKKIPSYFLKKVLTQTLKFLKFMKRWSRTRCIWATENPLANKMNGLMIALVGIALAACPPVPLSGLLSVVAIFLIGIGLLNNDGVYVIMGYVFAFFFFAEVLVILKYFSISNITKFVSSFLG